MQTPSKLCQYHWKEIKEHKLHNKFSISNMARTRTSDRQNAYTIIILNLASLEFMQKIPQFSKNLPHAFRISICNTGKNNRHSQRQLFLFSTFLDCNRYKAVLANNCHKMSQLTLKCSN